MSIKVEIDGIEMFDENNNRFITVKPTVLTMEHSLIAISKWESKFHIPFLREGDMTPEQLRYYFECMTINQNVNPDVYKAITPEKQKEILAYIKDPMTATWINDGGKISKGRKHGTDQEITSELVYFWMSQYNLPPEYEKWHFNRLLTLIQICNQYNTPQKKMNKNEIIRNNDAINAARRAAMKTRG